MDGPTRVPPRTHLSREQLRDLWLKDLDELDPVMAERYRENRVLFPMSRFDLIEYYTKVDLENFQLKQEEEHGQSSN
jgi:hypothetical protein